MPEDPSTTTTETPPSTGDPVASAPSPATEPSETFTQDQVNRMTGRARSEAKRAAEKEVAEALGVSVDEAKKIIEEKRQADEAAKTEVERAQEAAAQAKREADEAKAQAATQAFETRVYRKLSAAGVGAGMEDEAAEKRIGMARRLLDLDVEASDEDIASKIAEIKADVPGLFNTPVSGAPSGVTPGAQPPPGGQGTVSAMERGRQRARASRPDPTQQTDPFAGPGFRRVG